MNEWQKYLLEKEFQLVESKLKTADQNRQWLANDTVKLKAELADLKAKHPQARSQVQEPPKTIHEFSSEEIMQNYKKYGENFINEIVAKIEADPEFQAQINEARSPLPENPISSIRETSPEEILKAMKSSDNLQDVLKALGAK